MIDENKALEFINCGKRKEAEKIYRELIQKGSQNHVVYANLAALCGMRGNNIEMIELLKQSLLINPDNPEAYINLGVALKGQGDIKAAIASYKKALKLNPNSSQAHSNLGNAFKEQGDINSAIASCQKALKLNRNFPQAHNNLGISLQEQGDINSAIASYEEAIKLNPNYQEAYYNLGVAYQKNGELQKAISSYKKAIKLNPKCLDAHNNLGIALQECGEINAAISSFDKGLKLNSSLPELRMNISLVQLLSGDYKSGLTNYEWRWKQENPPSVHGKPSIPRREEGEIKDGEKILVISEQGMGDVMLHMRYLLPLKEKDIDLSFCAPEKLHNLIKASNIDLNPLSPKSSSLVTEGKWIPLISLLKHFSVGPLNPLINSQYIFSTKPLIKKWNSILANEKKPVIGINWQGSPGIEKTTYKGRSLPLEIFSKILDDNDVSFLSLQKGFGAEQLDKCSFRNKFVNCQNKVNEIWDFMEIAAIIENCSLIITCDTSVAHLAGGMGKKVWLLLKDIPYWFWGLESEETFWYPSMKLFRQKEKGNWPEVIESVSYELRKTLLING